MEETKERLYYKLGDPVDQKKARHVMRYNFSAERIHEAFPDSENVKKTAKILDFACGSGYGSNLLSKAFPQAKIIGYDKSKEAIDFAKENNQTDNIMFTNNIQDVFDTEFDNIILMDCIEHIPNEERIEILNKLTEKNKDALIQISTPLYNYTGASNTNPYHISCFTKPAYVEFLNQWFDYELWLVDWYYYRLMAEPEPYSGDGSVIAICKVKK